MAAVVTRGGQSVTTVVTIAAYLRLFNAFADRHSLADRSCATRRPTFGLLTRVTVVFAASQKQVLAEL
jgi:hypothetical protein